MLRDTTSRFSREISKQHSKVYKWKLNCIKYIKLQTYTHIIFQLFLKAGVVDFFWYYYNVIWCKWGIITWNLNGFFYIVIPVLQGQTPHKEETIPTFNLRRSTSFPKFPPYHIELFSQSLQKFSFARNILGPITSHNLLFANTYHLVFHKQRRMGKITFSVSGLGNQRFYLDNYVFHSA